MNLEEYNLLSNEELIRRIEKLKKEKNAVLLVHNYQRLEVQSIADYLGDSLQLSQEAAKTEADIILFCGVDFMAESAKILSPDKKVLIPDIEATCPMAAMVKAEDLCKYKMEHPEDYIIIYVNSSAESKAESYICCTSSNGVKVVDSLKDKKILFVPDKNLGHYCKLKTGADVELWDGYCYVHNNKISLDDVKREKKKHPQAKLVVHPECTPEVVAEADEVASTSGIIKYVREHNEVIIGTEIGLIEQLQKNYPEKKIYPLSENAICVTMKLITLAKIAWALENEQYEINLDEEIIERANLALRRMLEI